MDTIQAYIHVKRNTVASGNSVSRNSGISCYSGYVQLTNRFRRYFSQNSGHFEAYRRIHYYERRLYLKGSKRYPHFNFPISFTLKWWTKKWWTKQRKMNLLNNGTIMKIFFWRSSPLLRDFNEFLLNASLFQSNNRLFILFVDSNMNWWNILLFLLFALLRNDSF